MTSPRKTRKIYSAEELHRLRGTQSQPRLREAIEEKDGEDADIVKEHVLRGSRSFAARSFRSRTSGNSLRVPSNRSNNENYSATAYQDSRESTSVDSQPIGQVLGEIQPNGQVLRQGPFKTGRSPTPSIKKRKAEAIVKAHGSPTHVRVTAGGRIVPSDQSPLCHPRYGYSAVKTNGGLVKFAPNYPAKPQWTQATENGFVAQDVQGNLCQIVNGTILPLNEVDGALRLYMPAPNLKVTQRGSSLGPVNAPFTQNGNEHNALTKANPVAASEPSAEAQITALELEYSKLEHELKDVDKTEVIHGRTMGRVAKDALIAKRRELVTNMDKVRKAIKGLKSQPPPNAPTSPRAMLNKQSMSPPRNRLPTFLQKQLPEGTLAQAPFGGFGNGPPTVFGQFGAQLTPSPEEAYAGHPWAMPPAGMFVPPPPFDGGMAPPFAAISQSAQLGAIGDQLPPRVDEFIPQNDGARSLADLQAGSPNHSHAVPIRAPDAKPTTNLKSSLNPMSPVYKPGITKLEAAHLSVKDRVPAPLHQLPQPHKVSAASDETISPSKKSAHMHSSSISSLQTADFFPHDTFLYSFRTGDKENTGPDGREVSPITPGNYKAPPGTPNAGLAGPRIDLPDRSKFNVSPKSKREWLFIEERPEHSSKQQSSSAEKPHACQDEICETASPYDTIDFSNKPREWIEGYQAGLERKAIGAHRIGDFLQGYCAGLLKSRPVKASTRSPSKPVSRHPSSSQVSGQLQMTEKVAPTPRPPIEAHSQSLDCLKQAIQAPQNENAILTPTVEGPHVTDGSYNLGAWAKNASIAKHDAFPFPKRTSSVIHRQGTVDGRNKGTGPIAPLLHPVEVAGNFAQQPTSPALSSLSITSHTAAPGTGPNSAARITSLTSVDSSHQWSNRILTPTEWKAGSSVAHAANLATGFFSNAQFDGTNQSQRVTSITSSTGYPTGAQHGRFREGDGSLDGLSNAAASPSQPLSPTISPRNTPMKDGKRKDSTPVKGPSPTKARFEHMAEKVGIKVTSNTKPSGAVDSSAGAEPISPTGKRRWRDVWRKGGRDTE